VLTLGQSLRRMRMGANFIHNLRTILVFLSILGTGHVVAQCPHVYDFYGQVNDNPYWYSCSGNNFAFNLSTPDTWGAFSIDWGDGTPMTTGASWAPPTFQSHNYTAAVDTFVVTITEINTGCIVSGVVVMEEATSASIQIPVGGLTQACAPQMMEFINSSTNVSQTTVFTWDFGDGSPLLTFDYTNWNQVIQHTYEVGTVTCETEVSLVAENYCNIVQGGESEATFNPIRIWDLDDPAITASATLLCYPDTTVTFTNTTYRNCLFQGNIYQRYEYWNFGDYWNLGHDSIIDWTPWPPTFPHTMHYPGIGTYTVELLDSNYCGIAPTSITIQIVPPPVAGIAASADTVCVGEPITFYQQATGGANFYQWNFGNNWITTGSGNVTRVFNNPGVYTIANMVGISGATDGCTDTAYIQVVVLPKPTVTIMADQIEGCDAFDVNFDANITNALSYQWQFDVAPNNYSGADPPIISYNTLGDHVVSLTVTGINGCSDEDDIVIHVYQSPVVDFDQFNLCEQDSAWFTDLSYTSVNDSIISWSWNFGDGGTSTLQNPSHLFPGVGTYAIGLTVATPHCTNSDTTVVQIEARPVAVASSDIASGCSPLLVHFEQASTGATQYNWIMPDGAVISGATTDYIFVNNGANDTTLQVVLHVQNAFGCGAYDTLYIDVLHNSQAGFLDNTNTPGCSPYQAEFINTSTFADAYLWDFGDGSTSNIEDPSHLYVNSTGFVVSYDVELVAINSNGCSDTVSHPVIVYPLLDLQFDLSGSSGCSPQTVLLPFVPGVQQYTWDFGDGTGSTSVIPQHTFVNNGTATEVYTVTLIGVSPFGCIDTASAPITIYHSPVAQFTLNQTNGCAPLDVVINNGSYAGDVYSWNLGNGQVFDSSFVAMPVVFDNATSVSQNYTITLNATTAQGCADSFQQTLTVHPNVSAAFTDPGEYCSPATLTFQNLSTNASSFYWDLGNGIQSLSFQPNTNYIVNDGTSDTLLVTLIAYSTNGCADTVVHDIVVHPTPDMIFTVDQVSGCTPLAVQIDNNSLYADAIEWSMGDGAVYSTLDSLIAHTYSNTSSIQNSFQISAVATNAAGCSDVQTQSVQVFPMPQAMFTAPAPQCSPAIFTMINASLNAAVVEWTANGVSQQGNQFSMELVNNSDTILQVPVTLTATSVYGCSDTFVDTLVVYPKPYAAFSLDTNAFCGSGMVQISNQSAYASTHTWHYDDGISQVMNDSLHSHLYTNTGNGIETFQLTLVASNAFGCSDNAQATVTVYPGVTASFVEPPAQCTPAEFVLSSMSTNASYAAWTFQSGLTAGGVMVSNSYINSSDSVLTDMVTLIAGNAYGCSDTLTRALTIWPKPIAAFAMDASQLCYQGEVELANLSMYADAYQWSYGNGAASSVADSLHSASFVNEGNSPEMFDIELTASNSFGCSDMAQNSLIVYPEVTVQMPALDPECSPSSFVLQSITQPGNAIAWQVGELVFQDDVIALNYVNVSDSVFAQSVVLIATSVYGCSDTTMQTLYTNPKPVAQFSMSDVLVCEEGPVTLYNSSLYASDYLWSYGDGQSSTNSDSTHSHTYAQPPSYVAQYNVGLTVTNAYGCQDAAMAYYQVYPPVEAAFVADTIGCSPHTVTFMNNSEGGEMYLWDLGNGLTSSLVSPSATYETGYANDSTYTATLIATSANGCEHSFSMDIHVMHTPLASVVVDTTVGCFPTMVTLQNNSIGAQDFSWAYGDGFTSDTTAFEHTIPYYNFTNNPVTYPIQLVATTDYGCQDVATTSVTIGPQLIASFIMPDADCSPFNAFIDNTTVGGNTYAWSFGDGEMSNIYEPNHTFFNWSNADTSYTVELIVYDNYGCSDTASTVVHVYPIPVAGFTATPSQQIWPNATIAIDNTTIGGSVGSTWNMGNGQVLYDNEPMSYTYETWGDYTIQLVVSNGSCSDTTYQSVSILPPLPIANFEGPASGCVPLTVQFENLSDNFVHSAWAFGDGGSSNTTNPLYTYYQPGIYTVSLTVTGPGGETDQMVQEQIIVVHPRAQAAFTVTPTEVNVPGEPVYCLNLSSGSNSYSWDFGDGNTSTLENPLHEYDEAGVYSIQLIANNAFNCPDTMVLLDVITAGVGGMIDFPNAFTPSTTGSNGGYYDPHSLDNDYFFPIHSGVSEYHLMIFNKWGELLFESKDVHRGWDGYYRGELCRQDVYVWRVDATFVDGQSVTRSGDVTLIVK
jgi:PKD repeat protein